MPTDLYPTGLSVRQACREGIYSSITAGVARSYIQANVIVLPSRYAVDFRLLCLRNPVPCPLLAESQTAGQRHAVRSWVAGLSGRDVGGADLDLARDCPRYMVYRNGALTKSHCPHVADEWTDDHVAFLVGCSYSFETALAAAGLPPPHVLLHRNVAMYRTNIPLCAAGAFRGSTYVVSMRAYREAQVEKVREVTRPFVATHGEPIAWGWDSVKAIGIADVDHPEWGDPPMTPDGKALKENGEADPWVPVFWGCGVTPQEAVQQARLKGTVMGHAPGHMLLLDLREDEMLQKTTATI